MKEFQFFSAKRNISFNGIFEYLVNEMSILGVALQQHFKFHELFSFSLFPLMPSTFN